MKIRWCHNAKTCEIFSYKIYEDDTTDFPKGELVAYGDYLTTGFECFHEAEEWAESWKPCLTCEAVVKPDEYGKCPNCGTSCAKAAQI